MAAPLLVAALALAGCGAPGDAAGPSTADSAADAPLPDMLAGRTFLSTSATGRELAPGSRVTLSFGDDGSVGANAGCNHLGGAPAWDGDVLTVPEMYMTEMACEQPLMDQERWLADLLTAGATVALSGNDLTLAGGGVTLDLVDRTVADPDRPLAGTTWTLDGIVSGTGDSGAVSSAPQDFTVTLRVGQDRLDVFNGLTWMSAPLAADQDLSASSGTVRVAGALGGDGIGCEGGGTGCFVDVSVLGSDFDYAIVAGSLTVSGTGPTGGTGLMFRAASDDFTSPDLIGHTYRLTRLFTDAGGVDTRYDDARFTITFAAAGATAESSCGTIAYSHVRYYGDAASPMIDLGEPAGPACDLGSDPAGVPRGQLMTGFHDGEYFLSTGFVGWRFEPIE